MSSRANEQLRVFLKAYHAQIMDASCFAAGDSRLYTALLNLWATLTLSYLYN